LYVIVCPVWTATLSERMGSLTVLVGIVLLNLLFSV
jgi:hypothetical protein